ncbi:MAG: hypothetical protein ACJZ72_00225 [Opitutales bacterium]
MDYDENDDADEGVSKWPFYLAAIFIISLVIGFAYLHLKATETLDQWQLTTCILASGLASILVFIPHLIDRFLAIAFDPSNRKDEELHRKTYFDIKEMRSELEAFSVKVDKVPTLVDKIVSEGLNKESTSDPALPQISADLDKINKVLLEKMNTVEELIIQNPLIPEPDPALREAVNSIAGIKKSMDSLSQEIKALHNAVDQLPTEFPNPGVVERETQPLPKNVDEPSQRQEDEQDNQSEITEEVEVLIDEDSNADLPSKDEPEENPEEEPRTEEEIEQPNQPEVEEVAELPNEEITSNLENEEDLKFEESEENEESHPIIELEAPEDQIEEHIEIPEDEQEKEEESINDPDHSAGHSDTHNPELDLDLPDPEETIRKVDAILKETDPSKTSEPSTIKEVAEKTKTSQTGTTAVVANVMIGIGNKPYLRGEGPGLSWEEGVAMNFIEIGKWAWSPPRKNASLTVQLFRNDNDPDQSGKIEVKAGEKIEITPQFG